MTGGLQRPCSAFIVVIIIIASNIVISVGNPLTYRSRIDCKISEVLHLVLVAHLIHVRMKATQMLQSNNSHEISTAVVSTASKVMHSFVHSLIVKRRSTHSCFC